MAFKAIRYINSGFIKQIVHFPRVCCLWIRESRVKVMWLKKISWANSIFILLLGSFIDLFILYLMQITLYKVVQKKNYLTLYVQPTSRWRKVCDDSRFEGLDVSEYWFKGLSFSAWDNAGMMIRGEREINYMLCFIDLDFAVSPCHMWYLCEDRNMLGPLSRASWQILSCSCAILVYGSI